MSPSYLRTTYVVFDRFVELLFDVSYPHSTNRHISATLYSRISSLHLQRSSETCGYVFTCFPLLEAFLEEEKLVGRRI
jgi:hypothetical protein